MSKKKMVMKELDDALVFVRNKLEIYSENDKSENYSLLCKQLRALEEVDAFVSEYSWVGKQDGVKEKVKFIRESGYDYDFIRRELGLSVDALKSLVKRMNRRLTDAIGEGTIDMIISRKDTVSLGLIRFRICSGRYPMSDILVDEFYKSMPEPKIDFYNIFECEEEIKLMYLFSKWGMQEAISKCDLGKLAFLMYITQNPVERYAEEQKDLISLFQGINIGIDDYMDKLADLRERSERNSDYYYGRMNDFADETSYEVDEEVIDENESSEILDFDSDEVDFGSSRFGVIDENIFNAFSDFSLEKAADARKSDDDEDVLEEIY